MHPALDYENIPIGRKNSGIGKLQKISLLQLNKSGIKVPTNKNKKLSNDLNAVQNTIDQSGSHSENKMAVEALKSVMHESGLKVGYPIVRSILHDYRREGLKKNNLDIILKAHFDEDYKEFTHEFASLNTSRAQADDTSQV